MYRHRKRTEAQQRKLDAMRRGRERAAMAREPRGRMPDLPLLRRELIVIDYDSDVGIEPPYSVGSNDGLGVLVEKRETTCTAQKPKR